MEKSAFHEVNEWSFAEKDSEDSSQLPLIYRTKEGKGKESRMRVGCFWTTEKSTL
jgi:hypothetical protein